MFADTAVDFDRLIGGTAPVSLEPQAQRGYGFRRHGVHGKALLDQRRQAGIELVKRLKDAEGALDAEAAFWARLMALLVEGAAFDVVTNPPSSGKRAYSLAATLARTVAETLSLPYEECFQNLKPRGSRASIQAKLTEEGEYRWTGGTGRRVLLVDDAYCTGATLGRCVAAAGDTSLFLLVLCRS